MGADNIVKLHGRLRRRVHIELRVIAHAIIARRV